jgi:MoxR-like ATPase
VVHPVLRHRLQAGYEAEAQGLSTEAIISQLLTAVQVPQAGLEQDRAIASVSG